MKNPQWLSYAMVLGLSSIGCNAAWAQGGAADRYSQPGVAAPAANAPGEPSAATPGVADAGGPRSGHGREMTQQFVAQASYANHAEIAAARYALAHSQDPQVRRFARQMIHDHSMADTQLQQIAARHGFTVPRGVQTRDQLDLQQLEQMHGARFDAAYSQAQEQDHEQAVALFRRAEQNPQIEPAVRDFARKTLPVLVDHLHMAGQLVATEASGNRSSG